MPAVVHGERMLTDLDVSRLSKLAGQRLPPLLADLIVTAEVTSFRTVPADVVTMHSRVEIVDVHTHRRQVLTVCYPHDAQPAAGLASVLSPVGTGLIGLRVGDVACWHTPNSDACAATVESVAQPPDASADPAA